MSTDAHVNWGFRHRRRGVAAGTTFTNAIHLAAAGDSAHALADPAYADLPQFTLAVLLSTTGTIGRVASKGSSDSAGWQFTQVAGNEADFGGNCATTAAFKRASFVPNDGSWNWAFVAWDRTNRLVTRSAGPQGGAIADIERGDADGSAGAPVTEGSGLWLGESVTGDGGLISDIRFAGIAASILTLAQMQSIVDDAVSQAALFVDYWKPGASDTTQCASGKGVLPPLVYNGATLI